MPRFSFCFARGREGEHGVSTAYLSQSQVSWGRAFTRPVKEPSWIIPDFALPLYVLLQRQPEDEQVIRRPQSPFRKRCRCIRDEETRDPSVSCPCHEGIDPLRGYIEVHLLGNDTSPF